MAYCVSLIIEMESAHIFLQYILWNRSIRKFKRLLEILTTSPVTLGFAYHSENNDYEVVKISALALPLHEVEVYTLSSDSWRTIEILKTTFLAIYFNKN